MLWQFNFAVFLLQEAQPEKSGGISGWGIFGLILLGLFILLAIIGYFTGVQRRLKAALAAKAGGNMEKAEKLFLKILADEGADYIKNLTGDALTQTKQAFAQAHLELGEIHQTRGEKSSAMEHYKKAAAAGFELSPRAVGFLGEAYAAENNTSDAAINVYVHYIKLRPQDKVSAKVYFVLESACRVEESQKAAKRKAAVELNERVLNANPKVDWAHYYLGLAAFLEKNIDQAGTRFAKAQSLKPDRAMTYYWLGVCMLRGKKPDLPGATKSFDTFLGYKSEDPKFLKRQGRAAHELGMAMVQSLGGFGTKLATRPPEKEELFKRASDYLRMAVERDNTNGEYYFHLAQAYSDFGATDVAIATFESAVQLTTNNPEYFYRLGMECVAAQRLDRAATALRESVSLKKDDAEARALLAGVCLRINEFVEAETQCRELVKLRKNVPGDLAMLVRALYHQERHADVVQEIESRPDCKVSAEVSADAVFCIGHSYLRVDQPSKALIWFESVPKNPRSLFNFACALAHAGLYDHAHTKLDDLFENPAEFAVRGHLLRANVCLRQGNLAAAERACHSALELAPQDAQAHFVLGCVLYRGGKFEPAREHFEIVTDQKPDHAAAYLGAGLVYEQARSMVEAIEQYECISEHDPLAAQARLRLGILACRQMEYDRALALLEGLEGPLAGTDAHCCYLAMALFQAGRYSEAIEQLQRVEQRHAGDAEVKVNIARSRYMLGVQFVEKENYPQAVMEWERYLEVFPQDEKTRKDLAQVYFREATRRLRSEGVGACAEVEPLLERAAAGDSQESNYSFMLALCQMKLGKHALALDRLQKLTAAGAPGLETRIEYHIGLCLLALGQGDEAVSVLKRASKNANVPHAQFAAWAIANQRLQSGLVNEALKILAENL